MDNWPRPEEEKECCRIYRTQDSINYLNTIAALEAKAPTTKSGYPLLSKSVPPDSDQPKLVIGLVALVEMLTP